MSDPKSPLYQDWVNYIIDKIKRINEENIPADLYWDTKDAFDTWVYPVTPDNLSGYYTYIDDYLDGAIDTSGTGGGYLLPKNLKVFGAPSEEKYIDLDIEGGRPAEEILGKKNLERLYKEASREYFNAVKDELESAYADIFQRLNSAGISPWDRGGLQASIADDPDLGNILKRYYTTLIQDKYAQAFLEHIAGKK